jgi:predicted nucleotidyltransferase
MTTLEQIQRSGVPMPASVLDEAVSKIIDVADPEKILVFGSAARGAATRQSDLDLLVIKSGDYHPRRVAAAIYSALASLDVPVDVMVVTPQQVERYRNSSCLVLYPALREGRTIYDKNAL